MENSLSDAVDQPGITAEQNAQGLRISGTYPGKKGFVGELLGRRNWCPYLGDSVVALSLRSATAGKRVAEKESDIVSPSAPEPCDIQNLWVLTKPP